MAKIDFSRYNLAMVQMERIPEQRELGSNPKEVL